MIETLIMLVGVIAGYFMLRLKNSTQKNIAALNGKVQVIIVALIIFIMGVNLGSIDDFAQKMLTMGVQSLIFAIIPTAFSVGVVYFFSRKFIIRGHK